MPRRALILKIKGYSLKSCFSFSCFFFIFGFSDLSFKNEPVAEVNVQRSAGTNGVPAFQNTPYGHKNYFQIPEENIYQLKQSVYAHFSHPTSAFEYVLLGILLYTSRHIMRRRHFLTAEFEQSDPNFMYTDFLLYEKYGANTPPW